MDFGEANYVLNHSLKYKTLSYISVNDRNINYQFRKKSQKTLRNGQINKYWVCLGCEKILENRGKEDNEMYSTIIISNDRILKNPENMHRSDCESRSFGRIHADELDREARKKCCQGEKRPMEAYIDMGSEMNKRFRNDNDFDAVERCLPSYKSVKSSLKRWSQKGRVPINDPYDLPEEYKLTEKGRYADENSPAHGERWLLCANRDEKVVAFSSDLDLSVVHQSEHLIMDGTFKVSPNDFVQLYTVHAWGSFGFESISICHSLMQSKSTQSYVYLLSKIREKLLQNHGNIGVLKFVHVDFEIAEHSAICQVFPETIVKGCTFHFSQSLNRRLNSLGLRDMWVDEGNVDEWIGCLKALAFLPIPLVTCAFEIILQQPPIVNEPIANAKLQEFSIYFKNTWVSGPQFPISVWNHWNNDGPRITNHAEGYHNRLNLVEVREMHLAVHNVLHTLQPMHNRDQIRIRNLRQNVYQPKERDPTYVALDAQIKDAKAQFYENTYQIWDFVGFDVRVIHPHAFQYLMMEIHSYLRYMRHRVGKKIACTCER